MSKTSAHPDLGSAADANTRAIEPGGTRTATVVSLVAVVLTGAIFGFFYAWVCSTMWGLDDADPRVAIEAMQAMNASVRNAVFFPAFFLTPVALGAAALLLRRRDRRQAARWFGIAALTYLLGGLVVTMAINVPMNEDLAHHTGSLTEPAAARIWQEYSGPWQFWNIARTLASGAALAFAANGLRFLHRHGAPRDAPRDTRTLASTRTREGEHRPMIPNAKPADQCSNILEIRAEIDRLDRAIISLLGDRLAYVHSAAEFKTSDASVRALDRVETMLDDREQWATVHGLDPATVRHFYEDLIRYFTGLEFEEWSGRT